MVMLFWPDLSLRYTGPEIMDCPNFFGQEMGLVLKHLKWVNSTLGNHRNTLNAILKIIPNNGQSIHIVDIGCGGGDLICFLSTEFKKRRILVHFTGIDFNPNITAHATEVVCKQNTISFITADVLSPQFELPECDILISSHFVYHFTNEGLSAFLEKWQNRIKLGFVFSDLRRSRVSYLLFRVFSRLLFNSEITRKDGLTAIRRSFSVEEMQQVLQNFGSKVVVTRKPVFRQTAIFYK
jgi:2-polyprenyl-3-methyl-5-hydroxy-6-metoxy-1,4-benzoquinol methylase